MKDNDIAKPYKRLRKDDVSCPICRNNIFNYVDTINLDHAVYGNEAKRYVCATCGRYEALIRLERVGF